jgi:nucleoside-diphosphate-sugar epimerase
MVNELTGSKSEIVFQPLPQDDPVRRRPDISLAKEKLRWEPTIPCETASPARSIISGHIQWFLRSKPLQVGPRSSCKNARFRERSRFRPRRHGR